MRQQHYLQPKLWETRVTIDQPLLSISGVIDDGGHGIGNGGDASDYANPPLDAPVGKGWDDIWDKNE